MRKILLCLSILLVFCGALFAEGVQQKISLGGGGGLFKNAEEYDYKTTGFLYGGHLKYGVHKAVEIGVSGYYGYNYPSDVLQGDLFPFATRTVQDGATIASRPGQPTTHRYDEQAGLLNFDQSESIPLKFTYIPIELYVQFRAMTETFFNPFLVVGGGYFMWKAEDIDNPDGTVEIYHDGEWKEMAGNHFNILAGLGFEVFPVPQFSIDVGAYGQMPFMDEASKYAFDTLYAKVDVRAHLNVYYGGIRDSDRDGVYDGDDMCPDTPFGATVDEVGCPMDADQDGVYDGLDQCPKTPMNAEVDAKGCPRDSDNDGVYDGIDKCPGTPAGAKVDETGCAVDSDFDGVSDYKDACPNTPEGATVDASGCPFDTDRDGVYDGIDQCPNTAVGTEVNQYGCKLAEADDDGDGIGNEDDKCPTTPPGHIVDKDGCSKDSDDDGVYDHEDKCPRTPKKAQVDATGCPKDGDDDGVYDGIDKCPRTLKGAVVDETGCAKDSDDDTVPDGIDKCPRTPAKAIVDEHGCPKDTDGDGVYDGIDKCPNTPEGVTVDTLGCRKLDKGESITVRVQFESCKWDITPKGETDLKEALEVLLAHPEIQVAIEGHTDNQKPSGNCAAAVGDNMGLSRLRAQSVYDWLVTKGVNASQLEVTPYGASKPVADNTTAEGRALNRRIEFRRLK